MKKTKIENDLEAFMNEDAPLPEETRQVLIDLAISSKDKLDGLSQDMEGFTDYFLRCHMNDECLKCTRSKPNLGQCYGKVGGNPCLVFKEKEAKPCKSKLSQPAYAVSSCTSQ